MKRRAHLILLMVFLTLQISPILRAEGNEAPDPTALEQERLMKEDAERQAQAICDSILGKGKSSVLVNVELGLETTRKGGSAVNRKLDNKSGGLGEDNFLLPWVPAPKSVTKEEVPKDASVETQGASQTSLDVKTVVKRFDITVVHDDKIPAAQLDATKETLTAAFDRFKSVLKLFFRPTAFLIDKEKEYNPKDVVTRNLWDSLTLKNIFFLFLLMLAWMLLRFFLGPLAEFMKNYIDGMKEQSKSKVEMDNKSETENESEANNEDEGTDSLGEGELTPEEQAALEAQEALMQKFEPFKYVNDENIKQLAYLLHHEEPWVVAMVLSYLSAEHSFKVMEALPADLQAKVALETAMYRQTSMEQVVAIDEDIKQKIDFVVGGLEKLVVILENSDRGARDNILEYLKNEKPGVFEKVREHILLFEDIVNFPKLAMQVLVRELKNEQLAQALRSASPELQQKFFENMSQGAVTLLKEEMEYGRPVTDEQIEEERRKIIDLVKAMEKDGKLSFRQKGKVSSLGLDDMGLQSSNNGSAGGDDALAQLEMAVQVDPTNPGAVQALAEAYYAAGRYPEALQSYDTLLQIQPNAEMQAWVEELRANVSATPS